MAADWVMHGITENHLGQVISEDIISQYYEMVKGDKTNANGHELAKSVLNPSKIIKGNFYLDKDKLIFQSSIIDGRTDKVLISFTSNSCAVDNSLDCIKDVMESITGFLATADKKKLMLQDVPPKYEAYKALLEAKSTNDSKEYLALINRALDLDSNYFEPKVLKVAYYYEQGTYKKADSLLKTIKPDSYLNRRQLNLLNMYDATLKGDNRKVYETVIKEYKIAPFELMTNRTAMVVALQFVNKPEDVEGIFNVIKLDSMDFENCITCVQRVYVKALADVQLGRYDAAINISEKVLADTDSDIIKIPLIQALIRGNKETQPRPFLPGMI